MLNHKGKGMVAVVIHGNPEEMGESEGSFHPSTVRTLQKNPKFRSLFNQLGFGPEARRVATEFLMSIATNSGMECFTAKSHASQAFLETTNAITFTDEDMEVEHPDHRRPLYLMATINGVQIRRALVGEKRKRPDGKVFEKPPMIPCTLEELNHVLDKWIGDGVVRPFIVSRPPTEEERKNPLFCRIHNYVKHSTKDCWTLRRLFHKKLREGTLELTQKEPEV